MQIEKTSDTRQDITMQFELKLAWRHLLSGGKQTILTIFAVAIATMVVLFVQVTISGMQVKLKKTLIGSSSHVTIKPADTLPDTLERVRPQSDPNNISSSEQQPRLQQRTDIDQWEGLVDKVSHFPGVRIAAPVVTGSAFVVRGSKRNSVSIVGGNPTELEQIFPLQKDMLSGQWLDITSEEVVIGIKLANEMRLKLGDRVVLQSSGGVTQSFRVGGIFYTGTATDLNQVYLNLRAAQSIMETGQNISMIQTKLADPFDANNVAKEFSAVLPYKVDSWMVDQAAFLNQISSMDALKGFLTSFVLLASSVAVSAIMIVSVLQKNKQIGILKSMGAQDKQILLTFTLEGLGIALVGAFIGVCLALLALETIGKQSQPNPFGGRADAVVTVVYDPSQMAILVLIVIVATVIAAILPARQASQLNPVEVIRG
jgi:lipoprotein-releasing system permease protein